MIARARTLLAFLVLAAPALAQTDAAIKNVFWQPNQLQTGSAVFITVELNRAATKVSGKFLDRDLLFFASDKPRVWYALAGVGLGTQPGQYELAIRAALRGGRVARLARKVEIAAVTYRTGNVDVPDNFVHPDEASQKRIAADEVVKKHAFAHLIRAPQWSGDFVKPVAAAATDSFGMTRLLNEERMSEHRGTDFPIDEGSPVSASNSGTVVLARELFYEGNCIVVDHGQRFFTIYMHLSKIEVREGQRLRKGQLIGLTGSTGRVTGPHLHMGVRWQTAYLDPTKLLALTLPETKPGAHTRRPPRATRRR